MPRGSAEADSDADDDRHIDTRLLNLEDLRDVLSLGAQLSRREGRQAVVARHLLEALTPTATEAFFRLLLDGPARAAAALYLEGVARTPRDSHAWQTEHEAGRVRSLDPRPRGGCGGGGRGAYRLPRRFRRGRASRPDRSSRHVAHDRGVARARGTGPSGRSRR